MSFSHFLTVSLNAVFYVWLRFLSWFVSEDTSPGADSGAYSHDGIMFTPSSPPEFTRPLGTHEDLGACKSVLLLHYELLTTVRWLI